MRCITFVTVDRKSAAWCSDVVLLVRSFGSRSRYFTSFALVSFSPAFAARPLTGNLPVRTTSTERIRDSIRGWNWSGKPKTTRQAHQLCDVYGRRWPPTETSRLAGQRARLTRTWTQAVRVRRRGLIRRRDWAGRWRSYRWRSCLLFSRLCVGFVLVGFVLVGNVLVCIVVVQGCKQQNMLA